MISFINTDTYSIILFKKRGVQFNWCQQMPTILFKNRCIISVTSARAKTGAEDEAKFWREANAHKK